MPTLFRISQLEFDLVFLGWTGRLTRAWISPQVKAVSAGRIILTQLLGQCRVHL